MPRRLVFACLLVALCWGGATPAHALQRARPSAPDSVALGIVWAPPAAPGPALQELDRLHDAGATAVRLTALPPTDQVFARADTLGLSLFVDLPVSYVGGGALSDALDRAAPVLERLQALAQRHPSVQYVGLAHHADTTVPSACAALAKWTDRLHASPAPLRSYYVTPFSAAADRCTGAVDLPLLDTRGRPAPELSWRGWGPDTGRAGVGALGTWSHPAAHSGLRVPHSPERQARYLERGLSALLDSAQSPPAAVFAYRWRDSAASPLSVRRYGLHDAAGTPRPAADVVEGVYTGTQRVFAFPTGAAPPSAPHGLLVLGWGLIVLLAGLYARRPFVRQTALRYFAAHGFYRDAVRKGRDVSALLNGLLLLVAAAALGLTATVLLRLGAAQPVTEHVLAALPSVLGTLLGQGIAHPSAGGAVIGGAAFLLLLGWAGALVLAARSEGAFSMGQGLMLVAWPCWPGLVAMAVALVAATNAPLSPFTLGALLVGGGLATILAVTIRVLRDFWSVSGVAPSLLVPLTLASPLALVLLASGGLLVRYDLPLTLLWHLLTRT